MVDAAALPFRLASQEGTYSVALTVGVEEEFLVADRHSGALSPRAGEIVGASRRAANDEITPELNLCQIEAATPICSSLAEVEQQLLRLRRDLETHAAPLGLIALPVGTHPESRWQDQRVNISNRFFSSSDIG